MLRIEVTGRVGEGKSAIMHMIRDMLKAQGKAVLMVEDTRVVDNSPARTVDVVMIESSTIDDRPGANFDYLIGKTEAAAYELAQDNGFIVRIVKRNHINLRSTCDYRKDRVNLSIMDNVVVAWSIG